MPQNKLCMSKLCMPKGGFFQVQKPNFTVKILENKKFLVQKFFSQI
jgi:hypothetical protein